MSDPQAAYRFISWVRRGAASHIATLEGQAGGARVEVPVEIQFNGGSHRAEVTLGLLGPGDVVSLDPRAVVRTYPPAETRDAEPNYFPLIEFDQVDLPWRYTPRAADPAVGRVRPWFCLIALAEGEDFQYTPPGTGRPNGTVEIGASVPLPRLDQSWAWAHVQVSGDDDLSSPEAIAAAPERAVARLLCPRRLDPRKTYWIMLVPTFEVGRRAGLREDLVPQLGELAPAWSEPATGTRPTVTLPVYYRWRFGTGRGGDFEMLVRQLQARPLPASVGTRPIDVTQPGTLPPAATRPVAIGGALRAPAADPWAWAGDAGQRAIFVQLLSALLDYPDVVRHSGGTPVLGPPLYGTWHARRWRLQAGAPPPWFRDLNQDPRARIGAGLGTEVIQALQDLLMSSAWDQLAGIREANEQLRKAQLARVLSERLHLRRVQSASVDSLLMFTGPALGRVRVPTKTAGALVQNSQVRQAVVSGAFRRLTRPLGPLGRRQGRQSVVAEPLIPRINAGTYDQVMVAEPATSSSLPTWSWASQRDGWPSVLTGVASKTLLDTTPPPQPQQTVGDSAYYSPPVKDAGQGPDDSPSMARFRQAARDLAVARTDPAKPPLPGEVLHQLDLPAIQLAVTKAFDPASTIPAALRDRMVGRPGFVWNPPDPIEPVMAHPEFPQPMYKPLAERSPEWILPGLEAIEANSVGLAVTNPAFIEAYMVGLNHEMARELLWNEYPTDQRGSYFRQFWDPAGLAPTPVPAGFEDIRRIHEWSASSLLGTHSPRPPLPGGQPHLVLLVRGEVLRRYPGTLVYAQRAQGSVADPELVDPAVAGAQRRPVFSGRLDPDVAFFGFELTEPEVRGGPTDAGWFFVFEEQPAEPRFGLDATFTATDPTSWDDLAWRHLVANESELSALHYIDLDAAKPTTTGVLAHGGAGWHVSGPAPIARGADHAFITFQRPVRVAMHGSLLLP